MRSAFFHGYIGSLALVKETMSLSSQVNNYKIVYMKIRLYIYYT
jgi:hypothetical protein